jgi:hypothetical protein
VPCLPKRGECHDTHSPVFRRYKNRHTKEEKQLVMTYSNWKVKRDGRTREGLDELSVLSNTSNTTWTFGGPRTQPRCRLYRLALILVIHSSDRDRRLSLRCLHAVAACRKCTRETKRISTRSNESLASHPRAEPDMPTSPPDLVLPLRWAPTRKRKGGFGSCFVEHSSHSDSHAFDFCNNRDPLL